MRQKPNEIHIYEKKKERLTRTKRVNGVANCWGNPVENVDVFYLIKMTHNANSDERAQFEPFSKSPSSDVENIGQCL